MDSRKNVRLTHPSSTRREKKEWFLANEEETSIKDADIFLCGTSEEQIKMLNQIGIHPRVVADDRTEVNVARSLPPDEFVKEMSAAKANKVAQFFTDDEEYDIIIACESVVVLGDERIGKPQNPDDAFAILSRLNNRRHSVVSGITLIHKSEQTKTFHVETTIRFGDIPPEMFRSYIDSGECFGRNGAYNIHGKAAAFIKSVNGDFGNAFGFPVHELIFKLRELLLPPSSAVVERQPATSSAGTTEPRPIPLPRTIFPAPFSTRSSSSNIFSSLEVSGNPSAQKETDSSSDKTASTNVLQLERPQRMKATRHVFLFQQLQIARRQSQIQSARCSPQSPEAASLPTMLQQTQAQHVIIPASSLPEQQNIPQKLPREYISVFYQATGKPGVSDLRRIGIKPEIYRNQMPQDDQKHSAQDDCGEF